MANVRLGGWRSRLNDAATVLVIVASVSVFAMVVNGWNFHRSPPTQPAAIELASARTETLHASHPLEGAQTLGNDDALIAIVEYADFECQFCAQFSNETWPAIRKMYVDTGRVLLVFRHLPLPSHQHAYGAAVSAVCAGGQGRFWDMHDRLFERKGMLNTTSGYELAQALGLNTALFSDCASRASSEVARDSEWAQTHNIAATPSFLIGRTRREGKGSVDVSNVIVGAQPLASFTAVLDEMLAAPPRQN